MDMPGGTMCTHLQAPGHEHPQHRSPGNPGGIAGHRPRARPPGLPRERCCGRCSPGACRSRLIVPPGMSIIDHPSEVDCLGSDLSTEGARVARGGYLRSLARTRLRRALTAATLGALLLGCGSHAPPGAPHPAQVGVVLAHSQSVPLTRELVGRLSATRTADVRARVAGVLLKRLYKEGSDVRAGQALFQIDAAPLRAALDGAEAALAQAQANATNAHIAAERARELIASGLVSRSDLDNAEAAERSTAASVQQAKAGVASARINLSYATVTAPIAGRAGQQGVTEGALVGEGTPTLLTTVEQIDPIYVNFEQAAVDIERLRRAQSAGSVTVARAEASVALTLPDGTRYAHAGTLDFRSEEHTSELQS